MVYSMDQWSQPTPFRPLARTSGLLPRLYGKQQKMLSIRLIEIAGADNPFTYYYTKDDLNIYYLDV